MIYRNRYILRLTIFLTALLAGGSITVMAQGSSTGVVIHGSVFGGGNNAGVLINSEVNMSTGKVEGNVYGGGNIGDVGTHAPQSSPSVGNYDWTANTGLSQVTITGGTIGLGSSETSEITKEHGNVFGGGKGAATTFECEQGMVYQTSVSIKTTGSVVKGNVYGGGQVSRVENNTVVTIGTASGTDEPRIEGSVFGAGAGIATHGYSALVRGHSTVTVQGSAKVWHNVYGGGELASVGRYNIRKPGDNVHTNVALGMPYELDDGGMSFVNIQDDVVIGNVDIENSGHVYGAGKGLEPRQDYDYVTNENYTGEGEYQEDDHKPKRMVNGNGWEFFAGVDAYLQFVETLALSGRTYVTIGGTRDELSLTSPTSSGAPTIRGSVFGGSESGFVYHDTDVMIQNGTIKRNAFGGGRGLASFAEAGRVGGNTKINVSGGHIERNVYGGGNLGDVGTIKKPADYNYIWKNSDYNGSNETAENNYNNTAGNNKPSDSNHDTSKNTGVCTVTISGGEIGLETLPGTEKPEDHGNVFGAGKGSSVTWWCEKAIAYATNVRISAGTVYRNVYGGGQVGRVEDDAKVVIGEENASEGSPAPIITGSVFGAGAGVYTHGYSALVRGNSDVTVQGIAQVGGSVYGGGEVASVGRFTVVGGLPKHPDSGGTCMVTIQDNANIGTSGTVHNVYGACKGVNPATISPSDRKSMQLLTNAPRDANLWSHYNNDENSPFIWRYYPDEAAYLDFLETLALTSNPHVIIAENAIVCGSVFGGGERGITLGNVDVDIIGGTVKQDVYGGGSLANTNKGNWEDSNGTWAAEKSSATYTTVVNLLDGTIAHDVYGGGLGDEAIEARVYGDVKVNLNGLVPDDYVASTHSSLVSPIDEDEDNTTDYYLVGSNAGCVVNGNIFGCNNVNGTPKGDVTVHVFKTVKKNESGVVQAKPEKNTKVYELAAVYGGGNQAAFDPENVNNTRKTHVIIEGCALTSIEYVYGGGNAAAAPATWVEVNSCYEIGTVFAGGNGAGFMDPPTNSIPNPGANVGYKNDGTTAYGSGTALADLHGGTIHQAFGGSNTKGNIRESANVTLNEPENNPCPLCIDEVYGAGNDAYQDGTSNINLGCISYLSNIYGGSKNADINNDIVLTIQSGRFNRVFGGNNLGGLISGTITVNIEETGCHPIIIGQLYGGGNQASYTAPSGKHGPTVNVKSFTSIGEIYGGGYGAGATVTGDTYVNINVAVGDNANAEMAQKIDPVTGAPVTTTDPNDNTQTIPVYTDVSRNTGQWIHFVAGKNSDNTDKIETVWQPEHKRGEIGTIGNVFGGGNAAAVQGNTNVTIGNAEYVEITTNIVAGDTDVRGYYVSNNSTYTEISGSNPVLATANTKYYRKVIGVNITGNVYGGGNAANVSGDTNVVIGKETTTP